LLRICKYHLLITLLAVTLNCEGQSTDTTLQEVQNIPAKFYSKVQKKYASLDKHLSRRSLKYLQKIQKQENRIRRKLSAVDSLSKITNEAVAKKYESFIHGFKKKKKTPGRVNLNEYNSYIDTLTTSLSFLKKWGSDGQAALPLEKLNELKDKFNQSANVMKFITERKHQVQQLLAHYTKVPASLRREYEKLNKTAYYYKAQVKQYKEMLKDPKKIEQKALSVLNQMPFFQQFMKENSQLASLFGLPGNYGTAASLAGLQTRASVQGMIQQRIAAGGPNAMAQVQQNLQNAQAQLSQLKDKLLKSSGLQGISGEMDMPNFKPNSQKTKPFLKRLEYGFNVQFSKSNSLLPSTGDMAGTIGYKIDDKSEAGVGVSYKVGLGTWQHIQISSQGIGLRSYLDWKAPFGSKGKMFGNLYLTGGYEMNYNSAFKNIEQLKNYNAWQTSALIGLSKKYQVSKKLKGNMQLLYDFLAYRHTPVSQPFLFRVGYNF
jgi:hypothetical protein